MTPEIDRIANELVARLRESGKRLASAESCTGGMIAAAITDNPGASDVFERGFVTYSNAAKSAELGVPASAIERCGAVSREVALLMAQGILARTPVDIAVSTTGIAGPGGATEIKPVGLVHIAAARRDGRVLHRELRLGDIGRDKVRIETVTQALEMAGELLD
jgi:nicotinamide-nucleotide amidase